jgi:hypothetical protein
LHVPDLRRLPVYVASALSQPLDVAVEPEGDVMARTVRFDARVLAPEDATLPTLATEVDVTFVDGDGKVMATERQSLSAALSRFERVELMPISTEPDEMVRARLPVMRQVAVTEPAALRVIAPRGTAIVRLYSQRQTAFRLFGFASAEDRVALPYREAMVASLGWRYAPLEERRWLAIHPANRKDLVRRGQVAALAAQVRLEPQRKDETTRLVTAGTVLVPRGQPEQQEILEPIPAERRGQEIRQWDGTSFAKVPPPGHLRFQVRAGPAQRPVLFHRATPAAIGAALSIQIDEGTAMPWVVTGSAGYLRLPRLDPGPHTLRITGAPRSLDLLLDQRPLAPVELFKLRTVYALSPRPLRLSVVKKGDERVVVNAIVYGPGTREDPDVSVRTRIDEGRPGRRQVPVTDVTIAQRTVPLPPANRALAAQLSTTTEAVAGFPRVVPIYLGPDIVAGRHDVDVEAKGGARLWARFFINRRPPAAAEKALQWNVEDELGADP